MIVIQYTIDEHDLEYYDKIYRHVQAAAKDQIVIAVPQGIKVNEWHGQDLKKFHKELQKLIQLVEEEMNKNGCYD